MATYEKVFRSEDLELQPKLNREGLDVVISYTTDMVSERDYYYWWARQTNDEAMYHEMMLQASIRHEIAWSIAEAMDWILPISPDDGGIVQHGGSTWREQIENRLHYPKEFDSANPTL